MSAVVAMLVLAAVCWVMRILFVVVVPAERLPAWFRDALGHLAPAVLAALVVVETTATVRGTTPLVTGTVVGSLALAALVVRRTGSLLLAISLGLGAALAVDLLILA